MKRLVMVCACVSLGALALVPSAGAVECGKPPAAGGEPLVGGLKIEESSDTEFGESDKRLILRFEVEGCTVSSEDGIEAEPESSELDEAAVFGTPVVIARGEHLVVRLPVDEDAFDPGKHTALITVDGATVNATTAKVSLQKTEDLLWPTLLAFLCAVAGFVAACVVAWVKVDGPVEVSWLWLPIAFFLALVAAGAVWKSSYLDVDVWKFEPKTVLALIVGCATAAAGAAGGAIATNKVIKKRTG